MGIGEDESGDHNYKTRIKEQLESEWRVIKIQRTQNHTKLIAYKSS